MRKVAAVESRRLAKRLQSTPIDRPIFVTGLARSGTTMLLELLAQADNIATHKYRDFPFLLTPYYWNRFVNLFGRTSLAKDRPHQDGIRITPESPEAFEEPIWQQFFPDAHRLVESHVLDSSVHNDKFASYFLDHIKKILVIRNGQRYLSKGNYNVTRIEYLSQLIPDAVFIIPIRHPVPHVASLVRQHRLFCEYSEHDDRVPEYLKGAGHFEFGPQRVPVSIENSAVRTIAAWEGNDEHLGYAIQWAALYGYVHEVLQRSPELKRRILIVRYEDLCTNPAQELRKVIKHAELENVTSHLLDNLGHIKPAAPYSPSAHSQYVWKATAEAATKFGYEYRASEER